MQGPEIARIDLTALALCLQMTNDEGRLGGGRLRAGGATLALRPH